MSEILNKFDFHNPNLDGMFLTLVGIVWVIVVLCALSSVLSRPFRWWIKGFWMAMIVAAPLVGLLAYLPFSLKEELYPYLGFWRKPKS